jgi:hypothetical protein
MCCPKCVVDTHLITSSLQPVSVPRSRPVCLEVLYFRSGRTGPNEGGTSNAEASSGCATFLCHLRPRYLHFRRLLRARH